MIRGLYPLDVPFHLQEPNSCKRCSHSFNKTDDTQGRYLRCDRERTTTTLCVYARHETGDCGPAALHFKERTA